MKYFALALALAACGGGGQDLHDAIELACASPGALGEVRNREAVDALQAIAEASASQRGPMLAELVERAGVEACGGRTVAQLAASHSYYDVTLPRAARPCVPVAAPSVRIGRTDVVVGDRRVALLPGDKFAPRGGFAPEPVAASLADKVSVELDVDGINDALIAVDREADGHRVADIIAAIASSDPRELALIVDTGSCLGELPLAVGPVSVPLSSGQPWLAVALRAHDSAIAKSAEPPGDHVRPTETARQETPIGGDLDALRSDLAREIEEAGVTHAPRQTGITIEVAAGVPAQRLLDTIALVSVDAHGQPLFPRVRLATLD